MKFIAVIALAFSINAHATGGFDCTGYDNGKKIELFGSTGRVAGNPLISNITMLSGTEEVVTVFSKKSVVGYWNMGRSLKLAVIDENADKLVIKLVTRYKRNSPNSKGKLTLPNGKTIKIRCIGE